MADAAKSQKKTKKVRKNVPHAVVHILCSLNNTLVTVTDPEGNAIARSSAGSSGFKGTRKSTPYASQIASENAMKDAVTYGIQTVDIYMKGIGVGRDQSLRGIASSGVDILTIEDITSIAHGGCRKKKGRRV